MSQNTKVYNSTDSYEYNATMKYGKSIQQAIAVSPEQWQDKWLDYEKLKKLIGAEEDDNNSEIDEEIEKKKSNETIVIAKKKVIHADGTTTQSTPPTTLQAPPSSETNPTLTTQPNDETKNVNESLKSTKPITSLKHDENAKNFFAAVKHEVKKVCDCYQNEMATLSKRKQNVCVRAQTIVSGKNEQAPGVTVCGVDSKTSDYMGDDASKLVLQDFVLLFKDLIFLQNYAVMNYVGFEKILKKHDKLTGYSTKETYMVKLVSRLPFAAHTDLLQLISETQTIYERFCSSQNISAPIPSETLPRRQKVGMKTNREEFNVASALIGLTKSYDKIANSLSPKSLQNQRRVSSELTESAPPRKRTKS